MHEHRVTERPDGRWRVEYVDGWGKRRRRNGFISRADAAMFFTRLIEPHIQPARDTPDHGAPVPREPARSFSVQRPGQFMPVTRLRPLIEQWLDEGNIREQLDEADVRRVFAIMSGEIQDVSIGVADRLLCIFGLNHLWYLPAEDGGLEDIYFHPAVVEAAA